MIYLLIITLPVANWLLYNFPFWEATRDYHAIQADGAADTLHEVFHLLRGVRRGVLQGGIAGFAVAPLAPTSLLAASLLAASLAVGGLTWFFITFNKKLSVLRGLDPYYISADPHAAFFPDRYVNGHALRVAPATASGAYVQMLARASFKLLLTICLWVGLTVALALAVAAGWVAVYAR